jgi:hypothetical protein
MKISKFISSLLYISFVNSVALADPKVICSMTINSTNEIEVFKKRLNTSAYEHIELAPPEDLSQSSKANPPRAQSFDG